MGKRQEYLEAASEEFADASREQLLRQIAHCWKRIDDMTAKDVGLRRYIAFLIPYARTAP